MSQSEPVFNLKPCPFCGRNIRVVDAEINALKAENAALRKQVIELSAAVSDEEWGSVYGYGRVVKRAEVDSLIHERIIRARVAKAEGL